MALNNAPIAHNTDIRALSQLATSV